MLVRQISKLFKSPLKYIETGLWSAALEQVRPALSLCGVRWASKKAGSSKRNHGGKSPGQRLGLKKNEGCYVQPGMILVRQKMAFRWYPGNFVTTGRDRTLSAQVAGTVYFTQERWNPRPDTEFGRSVAPTLSDEAMTRTFVNVRPEPEVGNFKLKEQI
ncbi:39S ribosomal protein L27, mitochondrial-like [Patiria miniata]|uniref:Large ribosomal subunit protein bL27m n=1 Tax=Patiria miniata TaxID=46514 RepID=A0A914AJ16_PATMI|nr:39S ribosomal protein L27, mitochondrial-like [Patiria miniata]